MKTVESISLTLGNGFYKKAILSGFAPYAPLRENNIGLTSTTWNGEWQVIEVLPKIYA